MIARVRAAAVEVRRIHGADLPVVALQVDEALVRRGQQERVQLAEGRRRHRGRRLRRRGRARVAPPVHRRDREPVAGGGREVADRRRSVRGPARSARRCAGSGSRRSASCACGRCPSPARRWCPTRARCAAGPGTLGAEWRTRTRTVRLGRPIAPRVSAATTRNTCVPGVTRTGTAPAPRLHLAVHDAVAVDAVAGEPARPRA